MSVITKFYQFSSSGVNPVGSRHLTSHPSFIKELLSTEIGALDFGSVNIDIKRHSPTKAVLFRASSLAVGGEINNMRVWGSSLPSPIGTISYNMKILSAYVSGLSLTDASGAVPSTLPTSQNLFRTNGAASITGVLDADVSEYIYLNVTGDVGLTTGKLGAGTDKPFIFRVTYDSI
jgi:hypothetical protein